MPTRHPAGLEPGLFTHVHGVFRFQEHRPCSSRSASEGIGFHSAYIQFALTCIQPAFILHPTCIQLASKPIRVRSLRRSLFKKLHLSGAIYSRICVERFNFVCPHNQTHSLIVASRSAPSDNAVRLHVAQPLVVKSAV